MIRKEEIKVHLDTRLMMLLSKFSNSNRVSVGQGLEMIARIFLSDDDIVDIMVTNQHLGAAIEELKTEIETLKNSNYISISTIEKLREQIAEIEERLEHLIALA